MTGALTPSEIENRMEAAARTLRRLPNPPGSTPRGYGSGWPEYVQEQGAYGYHDARVRVVPSARDIKEMEECFEWLSWLGPADARIVWSRAEGMRWRQIGIRVGCVRQTAWRRWVTALVTISKKLKSHAKSTPAPRVTKKTDAKRVVGAARDEAGTLL